MSSIPTMFEILSWYLYGQQTKPEDYLDEKYIGRPVNNDTDKIGSVVYVNATEFMTTGAGRYVDVGNFKAVRKFLAGEYNSFLIIVSFHRCTVECQTGLSYV